MAIGFDPRLLGGKFTTPEQLLANPDALRARQEAVAIGFQGGSGPGGWGGGNYRRYLEQRKTLPQPIRPGPGLPIRPDRPYMPPSIPGPRPVKPPYLIDGGPADKTLLGGNFTTFEQLEANPGALEARRLALRRGFPGGDSWGGGNYRKYLETWTEGQRPIDDMPVEGRWPTSPRPPEGGWLPFPRPPEGGPVAHAMGTYPGQDPIARYYAMPGETPWPGDPSQDPGLYPREAQGSLMSPSYAPPVDGSFDPRLLGGNYTTQAALEANPTALANRQAGLEAGFVGGSSDQGWGDQRYAQFRAGQDYASKPRHGQWIPTASNDPRLLGGNYTTQAELADNPETMLNRQTAISRGFTGGEDWGQGRYNQWLQGKSQKTLMAPMPEMTPEQGGFTNLGQGQQYLEGLRQLKRGQ